MLRKLVISLIVFLTVITLLSYLISNKMIFIASLMVDITVIVFAILVWLNDRQYSHQMGQRIISFPDINMLIDIIQKQSNMLKFDKIENREDLIEVYRGKQKVLTAELEKDESGNILKIDGKYIAKIQAPEYVLQNIDEEIWSHIGRKK